jgi:hypothetical protein
MWLGRPGLHRAVSHDASLVSETTALEDSYRVRQHRAGCQPEHDAVVGHRGVVRGDSHILHATT